MEIYLFFLKEIWIYIVTLLTLKVVILINLLVFVIIPVIFKFSYAFQRRSVFLNYGPISLKVAAYMNFSLPKDGDYSDPKLFGLERARNFYVDNNGVKLGVWQILPNNLVQNKTDDNYFETVLGNGQDIVLYNHGTAGSRATGHRVELYKFLSNFFHVIAYDYRGYGDSSDEPPSEAGVVSDSIAMLEWIRGKMSPDSHLFAWGHSLGTSITLAAVSAMKKKGFVPTGVILEAPFSNLKDEISKHPLSWLFRFLPWFDVCIVEPLGQNGFLFQSDVHILNVDSPILMLHAEDDRTVPYKLGKKLYESALEKRVDTQGSIKFETFPGKYHYGHKYIVAAPNLHDIIQSFIKSAINETNILNSEKEE